MLKIRFFKFITCIFISAVLALLYVHQEIKIYKMSFAINEHRSELSFLLDQHRSLVYNLSQLESPKRVEDTLCMNEITLCMPQAGNIHRSDKIKLAYNKEEIKPHAEKSLLASIIDRFSAKAEAKVVK